MATSVIGVTRNNTKPYTDFWIVETGLGFACVAYIKRGQMTYQTGPFRGRTSIRDPKQARRVRLRVDDLVDDVNGTRYRIDHDGLHVMEKVEATNG